MSTDFRDQCEFYCVSYNSPLRKQIMEQRFANMGIHLIVNTGVQMDDPRLQYTDDQASKRLASCFYGHMDNIKAFYATGKSYGFFCEDDVHIHKSLANEIPTIIKEFEHMGLDILLLGYMITWQIEWWNMGYPLVYDGGPNVEYRYHRYPEEQWGVHLYMISRSYAEKLINSFGDDYAERHHNDPRILPHNPDWTISKITHKRALRYPMLAVEDGKGHYDHQGQGDFHRESHRVNYRENEFY
jgi:GR25 family glycosyltransferase involved in LPS biosynthesis